MNWDHLRYFLSLAEHGTLSLAAKPLNVSHTTVLRRVRAFEEELATQLFEHQADGYKLTQAGSVLRDEALKVKWAIENVSQEIAGADQELKGLVSISTTDSLAKNLLPEPLTDLMAKHPGIEFSLKVYNRMANMANREVDIAIRTCKEPPENLIGRRVGSIHFAIVVSQKYNKDNALDTIKSANENHNFIVLDDSYAHSPFYQWYTDQIPQNSRRITVDSFVSAELLCAAGAGIAVLPTTSLRHQQNFELLTRPKDSPSNDVWILSHIDRRDTHRVKVVRQCLFDALSSVLNTCPHNTGPLGYG